MNDQATHPGLNSAERPYIFLILWELTTDVAP